MDINYKNGMANKNTIPISRFKLKKVSRNKWDVYAHHLYLQGNDLIGYKLISERNSGHGLNREEVMEMLNEY